MRKFWISIAVVTLLIPVTYGQTRPKPRTFPTGVPVKETGLQANGGSVEDRTYRNSKFLFEITVPENWFIAGADFAEIVGKKGFDLNPVLPETIGPKIPGRQKREIDILVTAFRSELDAKEGAILRITAEDLKPNPQIKDAVDYFDAITAAYMSIKLPPDFKYSATKAEKLGTRQFAYLDTSSSAGKKRMYATVRKGFALIFTLSYASEADLETLKQILRTSNFGK